MLKFTNLMDKSFWAVCRLALGLLLDKVVS
jgi:hypothetical protein